LRTVLLGEENRDFCKSGCDAACGGTLGTKAVAPRKPWHHNATGWARHRAGSFSESASPTFSRAASRSSLAFGTCFRSLEPLVSFHVHSFDSLQSSLPPNRVPLQGSVNEAPRLAAALRAAMAPQPWHEGAPARAPPALRPLSAPIDRRCRGEAKSAFSTPPAMPRRRYCSQPRWRSRVATQTRGGAPLLARALATAQAVATSLTASGGGMLAQESASDPTQACQVEPAVAPDLCVDGEASHDDSGGGGDPASRLPADAGLFCTICLDAIGASGATCIAGTIDAAAAAGVDTSATCRLACGHGFHECCIAQWLLESPTCPLCKAVTGSQA